MEAYIRYENAEACFYATTAYTEDAPPLIEISCENVVIRIEDLDVTLFWKDGCGGEAGVSNVRKSSESRPSERATGEPGIWTVFLIFTAA